MPNKRPNEPIGPTNVPGQRLDPKIPPEQIGQSEDEREEIDDSEESEQEQQARESEKAFDQAITRIPPG